MDLKEIGREGLDWIHLGQDGAQMRALANTVNLRFPQKAINFNS